MRHFIGHLVAACTTLAFLAGCDSGSGSVVVAVPTIAAAAGYQTLTFSSTTVGTTTGQLQIFNFFGCNEPAGVLLQNSDGVSINGNGGCGFNADLSTAAYNAAEPMAFQGIAFGGGFYAEATFSFTGTPAGNSGPTPAFWANDIEHMGGATSTQWAGQAAGYDHWGELDIIEANVAGTQGYGGAFHDDYGILGSNVSQVSALTGSPFLGLNITWSTPNRFAALWIPATATTQGTLQYYFNDAQVGDTVYWDQYSAANPPPPLPNSSAASILDARHWALIVGDSNPSTPMKLTSLKVWQASGANNITH